MEKTSASARRVNTIGAIVLTSVLAIGGLTACGSGTSDDQPDSPIGSAVDGSDTSVAVKNGVVRNTSTTVPPTLSRSQGGRRP